MDVKKWHYTVANKWAQIVQSREQLRRYNEATGKGRMNCLIPNDGLAKLIAEHDPNNSDKKSN